MRTPIIPSYRLFFIFLRERPHSFITCRLLFFSSWEQTSGEWLFWGELTELYHQPDSGNTSYWENDSMLNCKENTTWSELQTLCLIRTALLVDDGTWRSCRNRDAKDNERDRLHLYHTTSRLKHNTKPEGTRTDPECCTGHSTCASSSFLKSREINTIP